MSALDDLVPIPPSINRHLSACREQTMLDKFGKPGDLSSKCSDPKGNFKKFIKYGVAVGPFKVSGLDYAVESLAQVFTEIEHLNPNVFSQVKTAGMLCVRHIRHNPAHYSNHSWGCAIDLYFGSGVVAQSKQLTQRGFLYLYEAFNNHGWYWGAGFSGSAVDTMHFELANETITKINSLDPKGDQLIAAADYISETGYDLELKA